MEAVSTGLATFPVELKTLQEAITLIVFVGFAALYLGQGFLPKHLGGFLIARIGGLDGLSNFLWNAMVIEGLTISPA